MSGPVTIGQLGAGKACLEDGVADTFGVPFD